VGETPPIIMRSPKRFGAREKPVDGADRERDRSDHGSA